MRAGVREALITLIISSIVITSICQLSYYIGEKLEKFLKWWDKEIKSKNNKFHK